MRLFIDDSGKEDHSKNLILAGYLFKNEKAATHAEEWVQILGEVDLKSFRMADAWRMSRNYQVMGRLGRDRLLARLIACTKKNADMAFYVVMPFKEFHHFLDVKGNHSELLGRPYFATFYSLLTLVCQYCFTKCTDQELEFVFDEQGGEPQNKILQSMAKFRELVSNDFPGLEFMDPVFVADKFAPQLQASDQLAWLVRREFHNIEKMINRNVLPEHLLLHEALSMPSKHKIWNQLTFQIARQVLLAQLG